MPMSLISFQWRISNVICFMIAQTQVHDGLGPGTLCVRTEGRHVLPRPQTRATDLNCQFMV